MAVTVTSGGGGDGQVRSGSSTPVPPRRGLTQEQFQREYQYIEPVPKGTGDALLERLQGSCSPSAACFSGAVTRCLPVLTWLPGYDLGRDLAGDVIAGFTVAVMHIPQGMAYALLAGIPPIHGIYMAFCQCLLYAVFGTARQLSVGTFAITCIMTGKVVLELSTPPELEAVAGSVGPPPPDPVQVATTVALAVGLVELAMFVLRAGALTVLLSDMLVQGFTTGAAVHVACSQLQSLFGLHLPRYQGAGKLAKLSFAVARNFGHANPVASSISAVTVVILVFSNEVIKPRLARRTRCPLPIELLVVIVGTAVSYSVDLSGNYDVQVIGNVTTGLPPLSQPLPSLLPAVLPDAIIIAVIAYSVSLSLAQLLARKHGYSVDPNQELMAHGISNVASAWFSCAPMGASLSRSLITDGAGGRTQLTGVVTSTLLLAVLLWLGPLFQVLPKCVLSGIIVVSLKGLLLQLGKLPRLVRVSRADALIWAATFIAVVAGDIDVGLAAGVVVSVVVILWRHQRPQAELVAGLAETELYVNVERYGAAEEDGDIRIFRFGGALHFLNVGYFRSRLFELTGLHSAINRATSSRAGRQGKHQRVVRKARNTEKAALDPEVGLTLGCMSSCLHIFLCSRGFCMLLLALCVPFDRWKQNGETSDMDGKDELPKSCGTRLSCHWRQLGGRYSSGDASGSPSAAYAVDNQAFKISEVKNKETCPQLTPLTTAADDDDDDDEGVERAAPARRYDSGLSNGRHSHSDVLNIRVEDTSSACVDVSFSQLVLDMSRVAFTDTASTRELLALLEEYAALGISWHLAGCNESVVRMLRMCGAGEERERLYPSVHDAVLSIRSGVARGCTQTAADGAS